MRTLVIACVLVACGGQHDAPRPSSPKAPLAPDAAVRDPDSVVVTPPSPAPPAKITVAPATDRLVFARACARKLADESAGDEILLDRATVIDRDGVEWVVFAQRHPTPSGPFTLDLRPHDGQCHWIPGE